MQPGVSVWVEEILLILLYVRKRWRMHAHEVGKKREGRNTHRNTKT